MFGKNLARTGFFLYLLWTTAPVTAQHFAESARLPERQRPPMFSLISTADRTTLDSGQVVVRIPESKVGREMLSLGAVRVNISRDDLRDAFRDIVRLKRSPLNRQVGTFSNPPSPDDLRELTLDESDLKDLRAARVGDCGFKLDAEAIRRFNRDIDWNRPEAKTTATRLVRELLFERTGRYLEQGNAGLGRYDDKSYSLDLAEEFDSLLDQPDAILTAVPELTRWLREFPRQQPPDSESFLYWSKDQVGRKPVISLTHVLMIRKTLDGRPTLIIATRQIYASHYFEGSLGLTVFQETPGSESGTLVYQNRTRSDVLRGGFAGMKRAMIVGELKDSMRRNLLDLKERLETQFPAHHSEDDLPVEGPELFR